MLVEWGQAWWKGVVLDLLEDGRIKIHYTGWDKTWDEAVPRERLKVPTPVGNEWDDTVSGSPAR